LKGIRPKRIMSPSLTSIIFLSKNSSYILSIPSYQPEFGVNNVVRVIIVIPGFKGVVAVVLVQDVQHAVQVIFFVHLKGGGLVHLDVGAAFLRDYGWGEMTYTTR